MVGYETRVSEPGIAEPVYLQIDHLGCASLIEVIDGQVTREVELSRKGVPVSAAGPGQKGRWATRIYRWEPGTPGFEREIGATRIQRRSFEAVYAEAEETAAANAKPSDLYRALTLVAQVILVLAMVAVGLWVLGMFLDAASHYTSSSH